MPRPPSQSRELACPASSIARLRAQFDPASTIWIRGALASSPEVLDGPAIAIVGARAASARALAFSRRLGERLARAGMIVVSGGALGVDAAAHEGALAGGGRTVAVLGTGVDGIYPARHADLFARIRVRGALVSPFPHETLPCAWHFAERNGYIAALASAVVVVEAGARSGSLGTARAALRMERSLYACPGSPGCDQLLLVGRAQLTVDADQLADRLLGAPSRPAQRGAHSDVLEAIGPGADSAELLATRTSLSLEHVLGALLELELDGRIVRLGGGRYLASGRG